MLLKSHFNVILLLFLTLTTASAAEVKLSPQAAVSGEYIRLGEIATITEDNRNSLARCFLGPTPKASNTVVITRDDIARRLKEVGLAQNVEITGAKEVRVSFNPTAAPILTKPKEPAPTSKPAAAVTRPAAMTSQDEALLRQTKLANDQLEREQREQERQRQRDSRGNSLSEREPATKLPPQRILFRYSQEENDRVSLEMRHALTDYFATQYKRHDIETNARLVNIDGHLPESATGLRFVSLESGRLPGKAVVLMSALDTNKNQIGENLRLTIEAEAMAPTLMLRSGRKSGENINPDDLVINLAAIQPGVSYLPPDPEAATGLSSTRALGAMTALRADDLQPPVIIKRGQRVVLEHNNSGVSARLQSKALQSGRNGDVITVEDPNTRQLYQAKVIAPNHVLWVRQGK